MRAGGRNFHARNLQATWQVRPVPSGYIPSEDRFEKRLDSTATGASQVYAWLVCGVAAAFSFAAMAPGSNIPMVGASGAISGVLAAYVLLYPRALIRVVVPLGILPYFLRISAGWVVGFWFIMQLVNAVLARPGDPGVAWWAHVGGFLAGGLLTPLFKSSQVRLFGNVRRGPWG